LTDCASTYSTLPSTLIGYLQLALLSLSSTDRFDNFFSSLLRLRSLELLHLPTPPERTKDSSTRRPLFSSPSLITRTSASTNTTRTNKGFKYSTLSLLISVFDHSNICSYQHHQNEHGTHQHGEQRVHRLEASDRERYPRHREGRKNPLQKHDAYPPQGPGDGRATRRRRKLLAYHR
jgi:hypothetical protein